MKRQEVGEMPRDQRVGRGRRQGAVQEEGRRVWYLNGGEG